MSQLIQAVKARVIQRGVISATNGGTGSVTVSAVDMAKAILHVSCASGAGENSGWGSMIGCSAGAYLASSTSITWKGGALASGTSTNVSTLYWQLEEQP